MRSLVAQLTLLGGLVGGLLVSPQLGRPAASTRAPRLIPPVCIGAPRERPAGTLILLRHADTVWDKKRVFAGWADPDLAPGAAQQVDGAARVLRESGYNIDTVYTSILKRSVRTAWLLLKELGRIHVPVWKHWRLNERSYGALTGHSIDEMARVHGADAVAAWCRSYDARPPDYPADHPHHPALHRRNRRWQDRSGAMLPVTWPQGESLGDAVERVRPVWEDEVMPDLLEGKTVLMCAAGSTVRGFVRMIDGLDNGEIAALEMPGCIPLVYKFSQAGGKLSPVPQPPNEELKSGDFTLTSAQLSGEFLGGAATLAKAMQEVRRASLERYAADAVEKESEAKAVDFDVQTAAAAEVEAEAAAAAAAAEAVAVAAVGAEAGAVAEAEAEAGLEVEAETEAEADAAAAATTAAAGAEAEAEEDAAAAAGGMWAAPTTPQSIERGKQHLVIIRHGKTEHNKLGLFTGWEDVSLAPEGRIEATRAGQLLKESGIEFDVVYTSWLSRAIETAWLVLVELDCLWLPIHKSWRLNERMYGALTGLSKKKTRAVFGDAQFKKWRRGYDTRPPTVSSFSQFYPGNDQRYVDNVVDVRWSLKETTIRSLERGRLTLHRKLPRTESLKDCMDRTIPYWMNTIRPNAIGAGKSVLVASSENAIRGLLMHLLDIPPERICEIEIPTGLPLVYDLESRCLRLLEGDFTDYNFGKSGELLFTPCEIDWTKES